MTEKKKEIKLPVKLDTSTSNKKNLVYTFFKLCIIILVITLCYCVGYLKTFATINELQRQNGNQTLTSVVCSKL